MGACTICCIICCRVSSEDYMEDKYAAICFHTLLELLHRVPVANIESGTQCKVQPLNKVIKLI